MMSPMGFLLTGGYRAGINATAFGMGLFAAFLMGVADLAAQLGNPNSADSGSRLGISVWQLMAGVGSAGVVWGILTMRVKRIEEDGQRRDREIQGIVERLSRDHDDLIRILAVRLDEQVVITEIRSRLAVLETTKMRRP